MTNGIWHPNVARWKISAMGMLPEFDRLTFRIIFKALSALGSFHVISSRQVVIENEWFSSFFEHISRNFQYFFMNFLFVARCYRALATHIKSKLLFVMLEVFRAYLRVFSIYFNEIFMVGRYYQVLVGRHQKFAYKSSS